MVDSFGNEIEYDVNGWVGEDNPSNSLVKPAKVSENAINNNSQMGSITLNVPQNTFSNKSTLLFTLMNDKMEMFDFFLYAKNDFKDNISLKNGKYEVVSLIDLSNNKKYDVNKKKIDINSNNVVLDIENVMEETTESTSMQVIDKSTEKHKGMFTNLIINILLFLLFVILVFIVIYRKYKKNNE